MKRSICPIPAIPRGLCSSVAMLSCWVLAASLCGAGLGAAEKQPSGGPPPRDPRNLSVRNEVRQAIHRGLDWLEKSQDEKGFWSNADHPALTALPLIALQGAPESRDDGGKDAVKKGYKFLVSCAQPDGGIYKKELQNYNTSISLVALSVANRPEYGPIIARAREFVIGMQSDYGEPGEVDTAMDGGIGYGSSYRHSDMSNTLMALEALYYSRAMAPEGELKEARDLNWEAALHFIQNCQNLPSHNKEAWASDDPANKGGFVYYPGHSMAGETNLESGRVALRSYGSISYAGLLSYIYADLQRDDPRVIAVMDWLQRNFTLEENPGMGGQGLFYYFHTMSKALTAYGADRIEVEGKQLDWRRELALKLINLQQPDGSWLNENGRWWERDPVLVTAYAVIALEMIHRGL